MCSFQPFDEDYDLDLDLDMLFRLAVAELMWEQFFQQQNFEITNFEEFLANIFDTAVAFIQNRELSISIRMCLLRNTVVQSLATVGDVAHFIGSGQPMQALLTHNIKRQGIKNLLRHQYHIDY